ncbi:hypothetical protein HRN19_004205 [Salmonella enterica]|nr:hypothetical protein [Salmonella enterica]
MLDGLSTTGLFFMAEAEFPVFPQNNRALFFPFGIPGTEDDKTAHHG